MSKGLLITTSGDVKIKEYGEPLYKTIGADVGGYIEIVRPRNLPEPFCMIVNEEGLLLRLPCNLVGSALYGGFIAGDVVFMKEGYGPDGPDIFGLSDEEIQELKKILKLQEGV